MNLLAVIDLLCDITTKQSDLLKELVTELEHTKQVSEEVKSYYRESFESIERQLDISEYRCREIELLEGTRENAIGSFPMDEAVSYTHLDVYKRQPIHGAMSLHRIFLCVWLRDSGSGNWTLHERGDCQTGD